MLSVVVFGSVLPFENNVTWNCDGPDLFDPSGMPIEVSVSHRQICTLRPGRCFGVLEYILADHMSRLALC